MLTDINIRERVITSFHIYYADSRWQRVVQERRREEEEEVLKYQISPPSFGEQGEKG